MKQKLVSGLFAVVFAALVGFQAIGLSAQESPQLWTVVVHFRYANGFEFDYVLATGLPTSSMISILQDCGQSHWTGSVVRYHCFPVQE